MRRVLFAALVLANLGLLIWGVFYFDNGLPANPEPQPPVAPDKMRLLKREMARAKTPITLTADTDNKSALVIPGGNTLPPAACYRLGPFADTAPAQKAQKALAGLPVFQREESTQLVSGYRVYLPPFASKEAAERKRRELTKLGFKDHAVMQEEGFQNALSLGLFSVEENARARINALAEKGVDANLQKVEQTRTVYWLEAGPVPVTAELSGRLKAALDGVPAASVNESPCAGGLTR
jgi:hypothetical protein